MKMVYSVIAPTIGYTLDTIFIMQKMIKPWQSLISLKNEFECLTNKS